MTLGGVPDSTGAVLSGMLQVERHLLIGNLFYLPTKQTTFRLLRK